MGERFGLAQRLTQIERRRLPDRRRQRLGHQRAETCRAHGF